ncbi:hypothetical protein R1sor_022324 [Riccia sorocarpa]|uniref:Uncharacterized protein n=1 Tax=Riccia sorocarpa TaxID=122646 RepID=A0ABD3GJJ9_9MARC
MVKAFKTGDGVYMQNEEMDKVGEGTIVSILPSFTVQTVELRNCSFAVRLDKVLQCQHALPYPDMDGTTLGEVEIGMTIRWHVHLLLVMNEVNNDVISLEDCEGFVEETQVQCSQIPRTSSTTPVDYKLRQNWYLLEVHILIRTPAGDKLPVAEGLVTFTAPAASVNNTRLGELNLGIAITNLSNGLGVNRDDDDDHQLSRDEGVDDILEDTPSTSQPLLESGRLELPRRKKRHYNSTVRNTPDPLRRARIEAKKRTSVKTTDEQIRGYKEQHVAGRCVVGRSLWKLYEDAHGSTSILYMLSSCYNKLSIMNGLNLKLKSLGGKGISKSSFYKQWTDNFKNFRFHQKGAFAKCDTCVELKLKLMEERRPEARRPIQEERNKHMTEQMSRRNVYYAKRTLAKTQPERYLCLIHDKIDQNKTNIPRLADNMKKLHVGGCIPLPISLTCKLTIIVFVSRMLQDASRSYTASGRISKLHCFGTHPEAPKLRDASCSTFASANHSITKL